MARPRKPPEALVNKRQSRMVSRIVPLEGGKPPVPKAPTHWLVGTKAAWKTFWDSDLAMAVNTPDHLELEHYFELCDERQRLMNAYRRKRMVAGSKGQVRVNPALDKALSLDKEISTVGMRFGITPLGRSRMGLQFGREQQTLDDLNRAMNQPPKEDLDDPRTDDPRIIDVREETG